jgi:nitroimidazol reductase NimA-like FMN-containing flavoprotein (pyridoxamine 5'-phosphate oxidase superfamily)
MDIEGTIRGYLPSVVHMSLATAANNRPWVIEVHFAYDDDLNIYFRSKPSRRHSQEILKNPYVAGSISENHSVGQKTRAVYFEGKAELIVGVGENHPAFKTLSKRLKLGDETLKDSKSPDGHKFYKITVTDYYLTDSREASPAQKHHLPWKTSVK